MTIDHQQAEAFAVSAIESVYRHYDQKGLDEQYNNRARFPNYIDHFKAWQRWSETTRSRLDGLTNVTFGVSEAETLDIFPGEEQGAPIYVFIHGGYWYSLDKSDYSYIAEGMKPHGFTTIVTNFGSSLSQVEGNTSSLPAMR